MQTAPAPSPFRVRRWQHLRIALRGAEVEARISAGEALGAERLRALRAARRCRPLDLYLPSGRRANARGTLTRQAAGVPDVARSPWRSTVIGRLLGLLAWSYARTGYVLVVGQLEALAEILGCAPRTITRALAELADQATADRGDAWLITHHRLRLCHGGESCPRGLPEDARGHWDQIPSAYELGPRLLRWIAEVVPAAGRPPAGSGVRADTVSIGRRPPRQRRGPVPSWWKPARPGPEPGGRCRGDRDVAPPAVPAGSPLTSCRRPELDASPAAAADRTEGREGMPSPLAGFAPVAGRPLPAFLRPVAPLASARRGAAAPPANVRQLSPEESSWLAEVGRAIDAAGRR